MAWASRPGTFGPKQIRLLLVVILVASVALGIWYKEELYYIKKAGTEGSFVSTAIHLLKHKSRWKWSGHSNPVSRSKSSRNHSSLSAWWQHSEAHLSNETVKVKLKRGSWSELYVASWHSHCKNGQLDVWVIMSIQGLNRWNIRRGQGSPVLQGSLLLSHQKDHEKSTVPLLRLSQTCYTWHSSFQLTNSSSCSSLQERQPVFTISGNLQAVTNLTLTPAEYEEDSGPIYTLSLLTTVKNVDWLLEQFLAYHVFIGFDHFFVYDDCSTDNTQGVLQPYIDAGLVTYVNWCRYGGWLARQHLAKNDFVKRFSHLSEMVLQADVDCYFYAFREKDGVKEPLNLVEELKTRFVEWKAGALKVGSYLFGPGGRKEHTDDVMFAYTKRANMNLYGGRFPYNGRQIDTTLSFAVSDSLVCGDSITHIWNTNPGTHFRNRAAGGWQHHILFNHYKVLSLEDFFRKRKTRTWDPTKKCCNVKTWEDLSRGVSVVTDTQIVDFYREEMETWFNYTPTELFAKALNRFSPEEETADASQEEAERNTSNLL